MKKLTYLATPYSHPNSDIREQRFRVVNFVAGKLMHAGHLIYSPISHTHPIAIEYDLPVTWEFWEQQCVSYLNLSEKLIVLMQDGWKDSIGVAAEMRIAEELAIPIEYMDAYMLLNERTG